MKKYKKILLGLITLVVAVIGGFLAYFATGSPADKSALAAIEQPLPGVLVDTTVEGQIAFTPEEETDIGIVFYPGSKVRYDAYAKVAESLADRGFTCVLVDMPINLAILNENAADAVIARYPEIHSWYLCGHSAGGRAATDYAWEHQDELSGLISLASRIQQDFSESSLPILFISATEDGLCTPELVKKTEEKIPEPENYTHIVIEGGCHAYFGSYGPQFHDGTPTITREEQQIQTVKAIATFIDQIESDKQ